MKDLGNYVCEGQMDIFNYMQQLEESKVTEAVNPDEEYKKSVSEKYPNCSEEEIKYILPILRVDASEYMREEIYKMVKAGQPDEIIINELKSYYRPWRREKNKDDNEHVFNFSGDMRYHAVITYPAGMELRRSPGATNGCCVNTWGHTLVLIKDMIAAGDYVDVPDFKTHPTLIRGYTCQKDHTCWCNRYGNELPIEEYKSDLIKGYSCAGCCYNCKEAPMRNGKCKWDCRVKK